MAVIPDVPLLTAVQFHRYLRSGRTRPAIFGCIDTEGNRAGDYVVKSSASMETGERSAVRELLGSLLARHLDILTPNPAIVQVHPDLASWLAKNQPEKAHAGSWNNNLNFASQFLIDVAVWPIGRSLPDSMIPAAANIFAFDAMIENDDRRFDNPNVLIRGDNIYAIDHELAFAFLFLIGGDPPWRMVRRQSLSRHVFYFALRKQPVDFGAFIERLSQLGEVRMQQIIEMIPPSWSHAELGQISDHLKSVRENAIEFQRELIGSLA